MSDLISRDAAKNYIDSQKGRPFIGCTISEAMKIMLDEVPAAESVRTAKVLKHKYWLGVSLNVVGEHTIGYEWLCENCKKKVLDGDDYCSHCGAKLLWGDENDF